MLDPRASSGATSVIVLGAGIAGLSAAHRLSERGLDVTVIDQADRAGGAHRSCHIGDFTFDLGSFFYEDGARIFELAPQIREQCPKVLRVQRRIAPTGSILHYPLEPREILKQCSWRLPFALLDLAGSRLGVRRDGTLDAISRQRLGRTFFRMTGLEAYMRRFHHLPPSEIDEGFFFHRMAHIERSTRAEALLHAAFRSLIPRTANSARRPLYVRPRSGFEKIFKPIVAHLKSRGVEFRFLESLECIRSQGPAFHVRTSMGSYTADVLVSTVPLESLHQALFGESSGLTSLDMTTLFVSADWLDPRAGNVLFNFHGEGHWKRATVYSRIYPQSLGGREFFTVEATIAAGASYLPEAIFDDFRSHASALGFARGIRLEGHARVGDCYPLYPPGSAARLQTVTDRVSATGVVLAGRQGRFEYLPTSSGVIRRVEEELATAGILARAPEFAE